MKRSFMLFILSITVTLCAIGLSSCTPTKYKVYFMNGDEVVSIKQSAGFESIALPLSPVKTGCTFDGWYFDEGVWEKEFTANYYIDKEIISDVTLYARFIESHEHNYILTTTAATCTEKGSNEYACACGDSYTEELSALGHSERIIDGVVPTCLEKGLTAGKICTVCGQTTVPQQEIEATGHDCVEIVTAPTCTERGYTLNVCLCGYSFIDDYVEPLGHVETIRQKVEPTCTEMGYSEGSYCSRCNQTLVEQSVLSALGHTEEVITGTPATCTENGLTDGAKCSVCNETLAVQNVIEAVGHLERTLESRDATCALEGLTEGSECYVCGEILVSQQTIEKLPHTEQTIEGYDATCTENGLTDLVKCSVCGEIITDSQTIDALGHTEEVILGTPATCTLDGLTDGLKCSVCQVVLTVQTVIPALNHNYQSAVTQPTCLEQGYTTHTCLNCDDSYIDSYIDATGHTEIVVPAVAPTCTEDGLTEGSKCATCNIVYVEQTVVDALGHTEETIPAISPTCVKDGLTEGSKCSVCGDILTAQQVDSATGHNYQEQVTSPTCTEQGYTTYDCLNCEHTYISNYIIALGHDFRDYVDQGDGTEKAVCENACGEVDVRALDQYSVHFVANGGSTPQTMSVDRDTAYGTLPTSNRTGYSFVGWYTSQNEGTKVEATDIVTSSHTLYAYWQPLTFTVSFDSDGGSLVNDKTVTYGKSYDTLTTPTKSGYTFIGWYNAEAGGEKITSATIVSVVANHTLYARWQVDIICTITFMADGAEIGTKQVKNGDAYGELVTPPNKTGYTFEGWFTSLDKGTKITASSIVTVTSDQTLYARYSANTYTVTFSGNGNTWIEPIEVTFGQRYGELITPSKEGYTFIGWFTEAQGGSRVTASTIVSIASDHVLYSQWESHSYTVSFNSNGGNDVNDITVAYGSTYGTLPEPTKAGYVFVGWFTAIEGGNKVTATSIVTRQEDHTLYARWSNTTYTVTFDSNGGTQVNSINVIENDTYGTLPTTTRAGYTFDGWFTALEGGTKVTNSTRVNSSHTLYAHWSPITYTITFNSNGGSTVNSKTYNYGDTYGTLATPSKTGYTFEGWFTALSGGTKINSTDTVTLSRTLYAHWTAEQFTITFNSNGGSTVNSKTYNYGDTYGTLATPSKTGYTFEGWFTALSGGTKVKSTDTVTASCTLYAQWTANKYTVSFNSNGGSAVDSKQVTYGSIYGTLATPTKDGYTFEGWFTDTSYTTKITSSTTVSVTSNITLVAKWKENATQPPLIDDDGDYGFVIG